MQFPLNGRLLYLKGFNWTIFELVMDAGIRQRSNLKRAHPVRRRSVPEWCWCPAARCRCCRRWAVGLRGPGLLPIVFGSAHVNGAQGAPAVLHRLAPDSVATTCLLRRRCCWPCWSYGLKREPRQHSTSIKVNYTNSVSNNTIVLVVIPTLINMKNTVFRKNK